ncbi:MAG: glycine--tRNA ligase subunit beta [Candidatus Methylomirabilales bacterium]
MGKAKVKAKVKTKPKAKAKPPEEKELVFEIGTEEIPSVYMADALRDLRAVADQSFRQARLRFGRIRTLGTPRRLTIHVEALAEKQADEVREVVGPPKAAAYDAQGKPTAAALGFARGQGIPVDQLHIRGTERGDYVVARKKEKGLKTTEVLSSLLPNIITALTFPKSMRWGDLSIRFVRPIRWLLAVYGGRVVEFEIDGIRSGAKTFGHRFLAPKPIQIRTFQEYLKKLEKAFVIVDQDRRREQVRQLVTKAAREVRGEPLIDPDLLEQVSHLVEYPTLVRGGFPDEYLSLPRELIITPMRKHQRYFPVADKQGKLLPYFVAVSNMKTRDMDAIAIGNECVLRARLADADFYYKEDQKKLPLEKLVPRLGHILFQERLGSLLDKTKRITEAAGFMAKSVDPAAEESARRAASLCKADLATGMIREFTELQGVMGRHYAEISGEKREVAVGIEEHYLPRYAGDALPQTKAGALVGAADRIDSIAGCFGIGLIPTGSEDPYALRRAALGLILILVGQELSVPLTPLVQRSLELLQDRITRPREEALKDVLAFLRVRCEGIMADRGIPPDVATAVLQVGFDDVPRAFRRAQALTKAKQDAKFASLAIAFKRVANILPPDFARGVEESRFQEEAERVLHREVKALQGDVAALTERGKYEEALKRIATLRPAVDRFFNDVLVMVEDKALRDNRLALLAETASLFSRIADFRQISA